MTLDRPAPEYPKQRAPYEHYREAERLLAEAARKRAQSTTHITPSGGETSYPLISEGAVADIRLDLDAARVHATLALARPE